MYINSVGSKNISGSGRLMRTSPNHLVTPPGLHLGLQDKLIVSLPFGFAGNWLITSLIHLSLASHSMIVNNILVSSVSCFVVVAGGSKKLLSCIKAYWGIAFGMKRRTLLELGLSRMSARFNWELVLWVWPRLKITTNVLMCKWVIQVLFPSQPNLQLILRYRIS